VRQVLDLCAVAVQVGGAVVGEELGSGAEGGEAGNVDDCLPAAWVGGREVAGLGGGAGGIAVSGVEGVRLGVVVGGPGTGDDQVLVRGVLPRVADREAAEAEFDRGAEDGCVFQPRVR
jgi:hypothetical protein